MQRHVRYGRYLDVSQDEEEKKEPACRFISIAIMSFFFVVHRPRVAACIWWTAQGLKLVDALWFQLAIVLLSGKRPCVFWSDEQLLIPGAGT